MDTMNPLPHEVLERLEERLGLHNFRTWIKPLRLAGSDNGEVTIAVPSTLFRDWLKDNYLDCIEEEFHRLSHRPVHVKLSVRPSPRTGKGQGEAPNPAPARRPQQREPRTTLIPRYTFDNFVVGASNQFAHAACEAVADNPADRYNPLFVYGGVGLGKTHLVNAVGHRLLHRNPRQKVIYTTFESFMNQLIVSVRENRMNEFKNHFRNVDVLIVDDIQFIAGKERTQEEFFHTFNSLYENRKQIIVTSDRFPKEIPGLEDRLRNRFEWGLTADIQPPDIETRLAILCNKAEAESIGLPQDVANFLATHIWSNIRELEGALTRLGAFASLNNADITIPLAKEVLRHTLKDNEKQVTVRNIQNAVADHFDVKVSDLKSKRRPKNQVLARQVAMYLCRKFTSTSFPAIGAEFGGRDHSTVIHATRAVEKKLLGDSNLKATVDRVVRQLKN